MIRKYLNFKAKQWHYHPNQMEARITALENRCIMQEKETHQEFIKQVATRILQEYPPKEQLIVINEITGILKQDYLTRLKEAEANLEAVKTHFNVFESGHQE